MRHAIVQNATVIGQPPRETEFKLDALVQQQKFLITRLVGLESELKTDVARLKVENPGPDRQKLQQSVASEEAEVAAMKSSLADIRTQIAVLQGESEQPVLAPALPGGLLLPPRDERVFGMSRTEFKAVEFLSLGFPLMVAFAIVLVRRFGRHSRTFPGVGDERFTRLEQAVESVAIEVERIGEAQRFAAKLLAERQTESASARDI